MNEHKIKSILIVDNSEENAKLLEATFKDEYKVLCASSTTDALEMLELDRYARRIYLVILSLDLPEDSGTNLLENMHIDSVLSEIPVIAITASVDSEIELLALQNGALDCMLLPLNTRLLFQHVQNYVHQREDNDFKIDTIIQKQASFVTAELEMRANIDDLTKINNKFSFCEKTEKLLKENLDKDFLILRFNIEKFNVINDIFGQVVGDTILADLASALTTALPKDSIYGRLENDHFVACVERGSITPEKVLEEVENGAKVHIKTAELQIKLGIYQVSDKFLPIISMCDRANMALQSIKGNYLKKIAVYDNSLRDILLQEQELVKDMQSALQDKDFEIYLQPIVSLLEEKVVSAEALVRWNHPTRGLIAPSGFVPFFEKSGLIATLDYYVWDLVFAYQHERCIRKLPDMPISMNISRMSLYNPNLCSDIINLSKRYDVSPSLVKLEVTESAYNDNPAQLVNTMRELQKYGFLILMDDFGSGYSSLNMLKTIPVDILKIDMCFLQDFGKTDRTANILTSVVRMAKWLNIPVVCEGVETQSQLDFLKEIGSDFVQGYYFSKPIPIKDFEEFEKFKLKSNNLLTPLISDVNEINLIFDNNEFSTRLFNSFVGAIGFYEFSNERLEVIRVNDNYYSMMGYTPQTFHSNKMNVFEMLVPESRLLVLDTCRLAVSGNMPGEIVVKRYLPDGNIIWLSVMVRFIGGNQERSVICCAMNNITEQKAGEMRVREQTLTLARYLDQFQRILDALPYGICQYTMDEKHEVLFANKACYEMYGIKHESDYITNSIHSECDVFSLKDKWNFFAFLDEVKKTKESSPYVAEIVKKDGSIIPIKGRVSIVKDYDEKEVFQDTFYDARKTGES
mgnify:CR=1 FL=1